MTKTFIVYMLLCSDKSYYVGVTTNLEQRLKRHQSGFFPECYTFSRKPLKLVWQESFGNEKDAFACEKKLKKWSRKKKEALIRGEWNTIRTLSKRNTRYVKRFHLS